jgi:hypothetical protein
MGYDFMKGDAMTRIVALMYSLCVVATALAVDSWPGGSEGLRIDITQSDMGTNMSGVVWNTTTEKLWVVSNSGIFWRMSCDEDCHDGDNWDVDDMPAAKVPCKWTCGGDTEAITLGADLEEDVVFVGIERSGGVHRYIKEYDVSVPGTATLNNTWELTEMNIGAENSGLEALTFVPDCWLDALGFVDSDGNSYTESVYGTGGLFFAGLQANAHIYVVDLDREHSGSYTFVGEYTTGQSEIAGMEFDRTAGTLYSYHNYNPSSNDVLQTLDIASTAGELRAFPVLGSWYGPRVANNEGIAVASNDGCPLSENDRWFFLTTDDGGTSNSVGIYPKFPCGCDDDSDCLSDVYCSPLDTCSGRLCAVGDGPCADPCEQCNEEHDFCRWCIFDLDHDGIVDEDDFNTVTACLGKCYECTPPYYQTGEDCCACNFDGDSNGCVGTGDYSAFAGCYSLGCDECANCWGPVE